jgi:hypothetical protein
MEDLFGTVGCICGILICKAMKAPEKIYLNPLLMEDGESIVRRCTFERQRDSQIEYIRTDAFIEKACDWLSDNLQTIVDVDCPSTHHVESIPVLGSITQTEFLNKFRKEIKYLFD